nr:hypothetical protein CFP56_11874 [Quercus suber]
MRCTRALQRIIFDVCGEVELDLGWCGGPAAQFQPLPGQPMVGRGAINDGPGRSTLSWRRLLPTPRHNLGRLPGPSSFTGVTVCSSSQSERLVVRFVHSSVTPGHDQREREPETNHHNGWACPTTPGFFAEHNMPIWPFKRRVKDAIAPPLSEKAPYPVARARTEPAPTTKSSLRRPRRRSSRRRGAGSPRSSPPPPVPMARSHERAVEASSMVGSKRAQSPGVGKENIPQRRDSVEDITALPASPMIDTSPHLRSAELARPAWLQRHSTSHTSLPRLPSGPPSRPQTLRSKRSTYDSSTVQRSRSGKKRPVDPFREDQIRAMTESMPIPIPKRTGDGPLRRDSKKIRGLGGPGSVVSIPPEEGVHSAMSNSMEQRGWAVGSFAVFSPRPAVRLSGAPQTNAGETHTAHTMVASQSYKEKTPLNKQSLRELKRQTIGEEADELDTNELRVLLERDAKRRERKRVEQQERLERKLHKTAAAASQAPEGSARARANSGRNRRNVEDALRLEEQRRTRDLVPPPAALHPALRDSPRAPIAESPFADPMQTEQTIEPIEPAVPTTEQQGTENTGTYLDYSNVTTNPFSDPTEPTVTADIVHKPTMPASFMSAETPGDTPGETLMEDAVVETAQAVRYAQANTPPLSPVHQQRRRGSAEPSQPESLVIPPRPSNVRQVSDPRERRTGAWTAFFRRGGTMTRKASEPSPSEASFSNTSRESMRNQPLPPHLVGNVANKRSSSGTPVRTMSRFREDLPELPISPPESRTQSPDVTTMAAAVAAARRAKRAPIEVAEDDTADAPDAARSDTPVSPMRPRGLVSTSMASINSEGSWLAGGSGKRQSVQSGLSRSIGSLRQRRPEFTASYEELGGDKDAEYVQRMSAGSMNRQLSSSAVPRTLPNEENPIMEEAEANQSDPMTVHQSVRRKPTLVHRDVRVKSREGLLTEYDSAEALDSRQGTPSLPQDEFQDAPESPMDFPMETAEVQVHSARSVNYGKGHARQVSAGSAKLLDMPATKRGSNAGIESPTSPVPRTFPPTSQS